VVHVEIRENASVSDCSVCLTMLAVVVVEMQGEISPFWEIWLRSQMEGMVWSARELWYGDVILIDVKDDPSVSVCMLGLTMVAMVVVEIWSEVSHLGKFGGDL
jgi:hypothetical protein